MAGCFFREVLASQGVPGKLKLLSLLACLHTQSNLYEIEVVLDIFVLLGDLFVQLADSVVELLQQLVLFGELGGDVVRIDQ